MSWVQFLTSWITYFSMVSRCCKLFLHGTSLQVFWISDLMCRSETSLDQKILKTILEVIFLTTSEWIEVIYTGMFNLFELFDRAFIEARLANAGFNPGSISDNIVLAWLGVNAVGWFMMLKIWKQLNIMRLKFKKNYKVKKKTKRRKR